MHDHSIGIAIAGSGGSGAITTGTLLLEAACRGGWYANLTRSVGAQIRGGEAVAMLRLSSRPIRCAGDRFDLLVALDWQNLGRYAAEMPLHEASLLVGDPEQGEAPAELRASGAKSATVAFRTLAQTVPGGRPNMVALGLVSALIGLDESAVQAVVQDSLGSKGTGVLNASLKAVAAGRAEAAQLPMLPLPRPSACSASTSRKRWSITGNQATGLGAVRGGVRYVAAYPITPATEVLEWMAPALDKVGGQLIQVEDELAAINQIIGASYGGVPALTATAGPGLSLMTESIGLAVASETPVVVVDVMRGGPSTGIPAKSEQTDLNIALYGLHGDAPHLVLAPNSVADCVFTTQWAVHLAETLQAPALVLSDQQLGQTLAVIDPPATHDFKTKRLLASAAPRGGAYHRYALTDSGVSPMALPGTPGCQYTADGLEHNTAAIPSGQASDHAAQLDKRLHKLTRYDYGQAWADIEGEGEVALITWGSCTGAAREALERLGELGASARLISIRLLSPVRPEQFAAALAGVQRALVVEQSHSGQFLQYLRANYPLPAQVDALHRPGPLPIKPAEILQRLCEGTK